MIRVASYNIRKSVGLDWRRDPRRILAVLHEVDADIVALQEVDRRFGSRVAALSAEIIADESHYDIIRFGARPASVGWHGNAILVREGAEVYASHRLKLPSLEPRGAVLADVGFGNVKLRIVGMHLGLVGLWRRRQARAVLAALAERTAALDRLPTVLMGDLNEWSAHGGCIADFARDHDFAVTGPSFHAKRPVSALDRIMVSSDLVVEDAGVHRSARAGVASDHLPVWARIAPAPADDPGTAAEATLP